MLPSIKLPGVPDATYFPSDQSATKGGEVAFQSAGVRLLGSLRVYICLSPVQYDPVNLPSTDEDASIFNCDNGQRMHPISITVRRFLRLSASASEN